MAQASACWSCQSNSGETRISPGPTIYQGKFWLVEHAYPSALLGWLVIVLRRHTEALHELSADEFLELSQIQADLLPLLHRVLNCEKEYVACFAELEHFRHVHFHVVPKPHDLGDEFIGTRSLALLKVSETEAVPTEEVRLFCLKLRDHMAARSEAT